MKSKRWMKFFKIIRPNFTVPTRDRLSNDLLDKSYKRTEKIANIRLERADCVSLIIDGRTNVRKDAIINIVALTPQPVFIKSIDTKGAVKNADYMFKILNEIVFNIGPKKVAGPIAGNEPKMNALAKLVQAKYKQFLHVGCVSRKLSAMTKHICNLSHFKGVINGAKAIITGINGHQAFRAKYREAIAENGRNSFGGLSLSSETRFTGSVLMMNSLFKAINPLKLIISDTNNQVSDDTKNRLLSYCSRIGRHEWFIDVTTRWQLFH